jgi:hypothetical protein
LAAPTPNLDLSQIFHPAISEDLKSGNDRIGLAGGFSHFQHNLQILSEAKPM